ncbi:magnesium and cobalt efflux protein CorC [bacterium BMS3Abin04]|nr:magnesium and cobalt efflux protein CorC [bacterium BMS3Abin04]
MDVDSYYQLILLIVLLIISGLFSGSEVALFSIDKNKFKGKQNKGTLSRKYILNLLQSPKQLLVTILIANTILNVAASIISVSIAIQIAHANKYPVNLVLVIQIIILTVLVLLFAEISPKLWASKHPIKFAQLVSVPVYWTFILLFPVSKILSDFLKVFTSSINYDKRKTALSSEDLSDLADISVEKGTIEEEEHELIQGLVSFRDVTAREVMTPRVDITAISIDTELKDILNLINESAHSRIPLYKDNLDHILGILYAKDFLPFIGDARKSNVLNLKKMARECLFVPETKLIHELMHEFQEKNTHIGIVVDEYGGTSGLISLEDILEEIVGEIQDEYDKEESEVTKISNNSYLVLGKLPIDEVNELLSIDLTSKSDDYDSLGGFIFNQTGKVPEEGYSFIFSNYRFIVKEVKNNRINSVLIEKVNSSN